MERRVTRRSSLLADMIITHSERPEKKQKMMSTESTKRTSISDLSKDILIDILSRLRAKDVVRSKSVCNSWRKLLSKKRFIELHLNRSKLRDPNIVSRNDIHYAVIDSESVFRKLKFLTTAKTVVSSCNGLLCLTDFTEFMYMFNPTTGECITIPFPKTYCRKGRQIKLISGTEIEISMGFGYDGVDNEYKVVRVVYQSSIFIEVKTYTLGTNSWKTIEDVPSHSFLSTDYICRTAHLNGVLHWDARVNHLNGEKNRIISFDLSTEKFGALFYPNFDEGRYLKSLLTWKGCLAVSCFYGDICLDLWVMKDYGETESWNKLFSISKSIIGRSFGLLQPLVGLKDGRILLQKDCNSLILYDPLKRRSRVFRTLGKKPPFFHATIYIEALTSIASLMPNTLLRKVSDVQSERLLWKACEAAYDSLKLYAVPNREEFAQGGQEVAFDPLKLYAARTGKDLFTYSQK